MNSTENTALLIQGLPLGSIHFCKIFFNCLGCEQVEKMIMTIQSNKTPCLDKISSFYLRLSLDYFAANHFLNYCTSKRALRSSSQPLWQPQKI